MKDPVESLQDLLRTQIDPMMNLWAAIIPAYGHVITDGF